MGSFIYAAGAIIAILVVALVASLVWLAKSRKAQVQAETRSTSLEKAEEQSSAADKIMEEPVADESAWLDALDERLRHSSDQPKA